MTRQLLTEVMSNYFDESQARSPMDAVLGIVMSNEKPITPTSFTWERVSDPNRLMKTYEFENHRSMVMFVQEILSFQQEFDHHAKMTVDYPQVIIEVYTHDVNDITELDTEYARSADEIRHAVSYYSETEEVDFEV